MTIESNLTLSSPPALPLRNPLPLPDRSPISPPPSPSLSEHAPNFASDFLGPANVTEPPAPRLPLAARRGVMSTIGSALRAVFSGIRNVLTFRCCREAAPGPADIDQTPAHSNAGGQSATTAGKAATSHVDLFHAHPELSASTMLSILSKHTLKLQSIVLPDQRHLLSSASSAAVEARRACADSFRAFMSNHMGYMGPKAAEFGWNFGAQTELAGTLTGVGRSLRVGDVVLEDVEKTLAEKPEFYTASNCKALLDYVQQVNQVWVAALDNFIQDRGLALSTTGGGGHAQESAAGTVQADPEGGLTPLEALRKELDAFVLREGIITLGEGKVTVGTTKDGIKGLPTTQPTAAAALLRQLGSTDYRHGEFAALIGGGNYLAGEQLKALPGNRFNDVPLSLASMVKVDGRYYPANVVSSPDGTRMGLRTNYPKAEHLETFFKLLGQEQATAPAQKVHFNLLASLKELGGNGYPGWYKQSGTYGGVTVAWRGVDRTQLGDLSHAEHRLQVTLEDQRSFDLTVGHVENWPDRTAIKEDDLVKMAHVEAERITQGVHTVTACRAGVGRTGTFQAAAIYLHNGGAHSMADIIAVNRQSVSPWFVQTAEQVVVLAELAATQEGSPKDDVYGNARVLEGLHDSGAVDRGNAPKELRAPTAVDVIPAIPGKGNRKVAIVAPHAETGVADVSSGDVRGKDNLGFISDEIKEAEEQEHVYANVFAGAGQPIAMSTPKLSRDSAHIYANVAAIISAAEVGPMDGVVSPATAQQSTRPVPAPRVKPALPAKATAPYVNVAIGANRRPEVLGVLPPAVETIDSSSDAVPGARVSGGEQAGDLSPTSSRMKPVEIHSNRASAEVGAVDPPRTKVATMIAAFSKRGV